MRLYLTILFDREIDEMAPSVGDFEVSTLSETYQFGFLDMSYSVNPENRCVVNYEFFNPDYDAFRGNFAEIETNKENLTNVTECYIDYEGFEDVYNAPQCLCITNFTLEFSDGSRTRVFMDEDLKRLYEELGLEKPEHDIYCDIDRSEGIEDFLKTIGGE